MATKYTMDFLSTQNKGQLRELMRSNGLGYSGMNNNGMQIALAAVEAEVVDNGGHEPLVVVDATDVVAPELQTAEEPTEVAVVVREPRVLPTLAPVVPEVKAEKVRKIQANRPEQHGVKRPSDGTICARIWAWCDEVHSAGDKVTAKELRATLTDVDNTTCTVQFYRWRKFNGIQGRT